MDILNQNNNNALFLTNSKIYPHNKIYTENKRAIVDYEGNIRIKSKRIAIVLEDIASNCEIQAVAFISDIEIRHTININYNSTLHDNIINNLEDKLRLDCELSKLKISIRAYDIYES